MPTVHETSETITELVYSGGYSPSKLIVVGLLLGLFIVVLLFRERQAAGRFRGLLLTVLRWCCLAVVLWMLAGPAIQTTIVSKKPKSVTFLVDTSASMGMIDPVRSSYNPIRWAASQGSDNESGNLGKLDKAATKLAVTVNKFSGFQKAFEAGSPVDELLPVLEHVQRTISDAVSDLKTYDPSESGSNTDYSKEISEYMNELSDNIRPKIAEISDDVKELRLFLDEERSARLTEIQESLSRICNQLTRFSDDYESGIVAGNVSKSVPEVQATSSLSRLERISGLFKNMEAGCLKKIQSEVKVNCFFFGDSVSSVPGPIWSEKIRASAFDNSPRVTDLHKAITQVAKDAALADTEAVVLFSDGRHNTDTDPRKPASSISNLPVYVVPIGNLERLCDVVLHHVSAPRTVFKDDTILIESLVDAYDCNHETLRVELVENEKTIDEKVITVYSDTFSQKVSFTRKAEELGQKEYEIRVEPIEAEVSKDNNSAKVAVAVVEDTMRVLLVDQRSRWEYRYLRNLFKREPRIECTPLLYEPRKALSNAPAEGLRLPPTLEAWSRFNVVILGDVNPSELKSSDQEMLEQYVSKLGGNLFIIAGDQYMPGAYRNMPLAGILPVDVEKRMSPDDLGYGLYQTSLGRTMSALQLDENPANSERIWNWMSAELPVYEMSEYCSAKPTSNVLITALPRSAARGTSGSERAFLSWHYYGEGRVVYVAAPMTYKLRYKTGDRLHHLFWGQLLRWAVSRDLAPGSRTVRLSTDKLRYIDGETVNVAARLSALDGSSVGNAVCKAVARKDGEIIGSVDLKPSEDVEGVYEGALVGMPQGVVSIAAEGSTVNALLKSENFTDPVQTEVTIDPEDVLELRNTLCNATLLSEIASLTGGTVVPPTGVQALLSALDLAPEITKKVEIKALWNKWLFLWIFICCLTIEWILRKRRGMA